MKRTLIPTAILTIILMSAINMPAYSTIHTVQVGNYYFSPQNLNGVNAGDTVRWVWVEGSHTTTSTTIPAGAASWDELINASNQTYDYVPAVGGTYNYKCTPHAGMGMVGSFTVTAAAPLTVSASATPSSICMGGSSIVACFPEGGTGSYTYSWVSSPPGFTSNQQSFTVSPMQTTTYTVTVTSGSQTASASATVSVQMQCMVTCEGDTSYCSDVISFPVSATASNYSTVSWSTMGDGTFENATSLTATYTPGPNDITAGMVNLICEVTPMAPCMMPATDQVSVGLESCTGINNHKNGSISLTAYPNPSNGQFSLRTGTMTGTASLRIFDMQGRVVYSEMLNAGNSELSIRGLSPGIYQATITESAGDRTGTVRILVR